MTINQLRERVRVWFPRDLLDLRGGMLEQMSRQWNGGPNGRFYPHGSAVIRVTPVSDAERAAAPRVLDAAELARDLRERLRPLGVPLSAGFRVILELEDPRPQPGGASFDIRYELAQPESKPEPAAIPKAALAEQDGRRHAITKIKTCVGRTPQATSRGEVRRENDVVMADDQYVGRAHCHIRYDPAAGTFLLYQDRAENRVRVSRSGDWYDLTVVREGFPLRDGDEIWLGRSVLRFVLG